MASHIVSHIYIFRCIVSHFRRHTGQNFPREHAPEPPKQESKWQTAMKFSSN